MRSYSTSLKPQFHLFTNLTHPCMLWTLVSNSVFFSVCSHSHESAAAQQVGGQEEAGHQSSEGHRSTAHTETHHQLPLLPVSVRSGISARRKTEESPSRSIILRRTQQRCHCDRYDSSRHTVESQAQSSHSLHSGAKTEEDPNSSTEVI